MSTIGSSHIVYSKSHPNNIDLTDDQWTLVEQLLIPVERQIGPGRPPVPLRRVLDGILWKLRTAAAWDELPPEFPSHQTCYRYYRRWLQSGALEQVLRALTFHLESNGIDLETALLEEDIEILDARHGAVLLFNYGLYGTWQASTAQLLLQVHQTRARRLGLAKGKLIPASPADRY